MFSVITASIAGPTRSLATSQTARREVDQCEDLSCILVLGLSLVVAACTMSPEERRRQTQVAVTQVASTWTRSLTDNDTYLCADGDGSGYCCINRQHLDKDPCTNNDTCLCADGDGSGYCCINRQHLDKDPCANNGTYPAPTPMATPTPTPEPPAIVGRLQAALSYDVDGRAVSRRVVSRKLATTWSLDASEDPGKSLWYKFNAEDFRYSKQTMLLRMSSSRTWKVWKLS